MKSAQVVCEDLVRIYKVANLEVVALQGLNLSVSAGEMVGIVGVSGSGKSTLMNIVGGLDRPSAGKVWVNGKDLLKLSPAELDKFRSKTVGFVWQQTTRNLIPYLSAIENVEIPVNLSSGMSKSEREYCMHLLETLGLADRMNHKLSELSGGQQQRVAIAVALANRPKLLLADEPTGEVDRQTAIEIYGAFKELNAEYGLTTMIVSHDPHIASYVDRVVAIRDGRLASETVRQHKQGEQVASELIEEEDFEEWVVMDKAGRLQIPKGLREEAGLKHRVRIEVVEEGVLIKPAGQYQQSEELEDMEYEREEREYHWPQWSISNVVRRVSTILDKWKKPDRNQGSEG